MAIDDNIIGEWLFTEASGTNVANTVGTSDLTLTTGGVGTWTTSATGDGINFSTLTHGGGIGIEDLSVNATDISDGLGTGSTGMGFALVVSGLEGTTNGERVFHIGSDAATGDSFLTVYSADRFNDAGFGKETTDALGVSFRYRSTTVPPSAATLIVCSIDTTQGTEANRIQLYINGALEAESARYQDASSTLPDFKTAGHNLYVMNRGSLDRGAKGSVYAVALFNAPIPAAQAGLIYDQWVLDNNTSLVPTSGATVTPQTATLGLSATEPLVTHIPAAVTVTPQTATLGLSATEPLVTHIPAAVTVTPQTATLGLSATEPLVTHMPAAVTVTPQTATLGLSATEPLVTNAASFEEATLGITLVEAPPAPVTVTPQTATLGLSTTEPLVTHIPAAVTVTPQTATLGLSATEPLVTHMPAAVTVTVQTATFAMASTEPAVSQSGIPMAELTNPTKDETGDGATLTVESTSDLGTLYSYSKTTAFTGTDEENAAEIIAQGVGQAPVVGTNTRIVTDQDPLTPHYAGWVQDSDGYGTDLAMEFHIATDAETLTIPATAGTYLFDIDWGDGTVETGLTTEGAGPHTYTLAGDYVVRISGTFPAISIGHESQLTEIFNLGAVGWTVGTSSFIGSSCRAITAGACDTSQLNIMNGTFRNLYDLESAPDFRGMDTRKVTSLAGALRAWLNVGPVDIAIDEWEIPLVTNATNMLEASQLTTACYDRTLASWGNQTLAAGALSTTIHFGSSTYTDADSHNLLLDQCAGIIDGGYLTSLKGNGIRHIQIPEFTAATTYDIRLEAEHRDTGSQSFHDLLSGGGGQTELFVYDSDHATKADDLDIKLGSATFTVAGFFANIAQGEHYTFRDERHTDRLHNLYLNGVLVATADRSNTLSVSIIGARTNGNNAIPTGSTIYNVSIEDTSNGNYIQYKIDEGSGTTVYAYDSNGDVIAGEEGTITPDADWVV